LDFPAATAIAQILQTGVTPAIIRPMAETRPAWLQNWFERHQHPVSRWLHYVGIPLAVAALVLALVQLIGWRWGLWWRPAALLFLGYLLQFIGHRIEGNDVGEVILIKRLLGRPYCAISPRYRER
jgi:hypothetical protein